MIPLFTVSILGFCFTRLPRRQHKCFSTGEINMDAIKMLAIVLIVAGSLALVYGGFSYTKDTQQAKLGAIELSVKETQTVNIPVWVGVGSIVAGMILIFVRK